MEQYTKFAKVYDRMMDNIPYEEWEEYLLQVFFHHHVDPLSTVLELGCGTGNISTLLQRDGFDVTGIDISEDMLRVAREKSNKIKSNKGKNSSEPGVSPITYICADMRDFTLPEKKNVVVSLCDSMNYLLTEEDLYRTMLSAKNALIDGGLFIFDLKTEYFFSEILGKNSFREKHSDFKAVWKNSYDAKDRIHNYELSIKMREGGKWNLYEENHKQHPFTAAEIKRAALRAGFTKGAAYDAFTFDKPRKHSERIYIVLVPVTVTGTIGYCSR